MPEAALTSAIQSVPAGAWAVAVSGGADSVALLRLLERRKDLSLHVVHLDHQTRGAESTGDADFVRDLARSLSLSCTIALRSEVEATLPSLPANTSARYRAARMALYRSVVLRHELAGVALAHHADDQAETIFTRLLRGSGAMGLTGMESLVAVGGLQIARPLLGARSGELRGYLRETGQNWREDASNESDKYLRNRLRRFLAGDERMFAALLDVGDTCRTLREWVRGAAPMLEASFRMERLANLSSILSTESARRWLCERGVPPDQITPDSASRLVQMASDAGTAARTHFSANVLVQRKGRIIGVCTVAP